MNRYLLRISYIGTNFKSFTKFTENGVPITPTTIGAIEQAMQALNPKNSIDVRTISRTDAGVHALNSAVVVDLERKYGKLYDCNYITATLNESFECASQQIRVNRTEMVPNSFNERLNVVKSRTYLYRLGMIKPHRGINRTIEEESRCYFKYSDRFDEKRFREAAEMLVGRHDFRTFMAINSDSHLRPSFSMREINFIKIKRCQGRTTEPCDHDDDIQYFDIIFNAPSYVYRQIRRMVGSLIAVAENRITHRDLYEMLTIPAKSSFSNKIFTVPPHGLYLADIEFRETSFDP